MTEWLKVADCKSVRLFLRRFKSYLFQMFEMWRSLVSVSVLGTEGHVFKSHRFEQLNSFNIIVHSLIIWEQVLVKS